MADADIRSRIAGNLKLIRKSRGFKSGKSFAEYVGITASKYSEYEQGRVAVPLDMAVLFAEKLECSVDDIAGMPKPHSADSTESELMECYRSSTEQRRETIVSIARDQAELSKNS